VVFGRFKFFCSMRKSVDDLRKLLEDIVVPAFCVSQLDVDEERKLKLTRVGVFLFLTGFSFYLNRLNLLDPGLFTKFDSPVVLYRIIFM